MKSLSNSSWEPTGGWGVPGAGSASIRATVPGVNNPHGCACSGTPSLPEATDHGLRTLRFYHPGSFFPAGAKAPVEAVLIPRGLPGAQDWLRKLIRQNAWGKKNFPLD